MIIMVKTAERMTGDYGEYVKVSGSDGDGKPVNKNVSEKFKDKWELLVENALLEFKMVQKDNKWNIADIIPASEQPLPPAVKPETHHEEGKPPEKILPAKEVAPQAIGMMTKEIGDMIRANKLTTIFGKENAEELIKWYRSQTFGITKASFDGSKLPKFPSKPEEIPQDKIPY